MLYIQFLAPDDGRRNRLKHVENFTEINKLYNFASCWLYTYLKKKTFAMLEPMNVKFKIETSVTKQSNCDICFPL